MTSEDWVFRVVSSFYDQVKDDVLIGYHFRNIKDFDQHIPRIASFWDLQLSGKTNRVLSEPFDVIRVHVPLGIKRGELGRWLVLFRRTLQAQVHLHPEFEELKKNWEVKLGIFEGIFSRFFGF
ncbi:MAG TPA: hypothetical protein VNJ01_09465 [Bacteriovoracaceae bacterium]|nr:hypothetical protein [Bacteriovoracaceae bacterium]